MTADGRCRPGQVVQEALHALHFLLDELHVDPDAAQEQRLVTKEAQQRAHGARRELSHGSGCWLLLQRRHARLLSLSSSAAPPPWCVLNFQLTSEA